MDYYTNIQRAIDFIELNLKQDIDILSVVERTHFSVTHFYRIFQSMVGDSVKNYIQKRRLSNILAQDTVLGICEYMPNITDESEFCYFAGIEVKNFSDIPKEMLIKIIPNSKYTVFTHKGSLSKLKDTYNFIYGVWLPQFRYELPELDTMEIYDCTSNAANSEFGIHIPLKC